MYTDAPRPLRPGAMFYPGLWSMIPVMDQHPSYQQTVSGLKFCKSPVVAIRASVVRCAKNSSETVIPVIHAFC